MFLVGGAPNAESVRPTALVRRAGAGSIAGARFTVRNEISPRETASLVVSSSPDRADPHPLDGATVVGDAYVFVDSDERVQRAELYLDRSTSQAPTRVEQHPPFDLGATNQKTLLALPMPTAQLGVGVHTLIVVVSLDTGDTSFLSARFTATESPPPTTTPPLPTRPPATTGPRSPVTTAPSRAQTVGQKYGGFSQGLSLTYRPESDLLRELDEMRAIGASWLRADVPWSMAQPNGRGTGFNWAQSDRWIEPALERGFKILPILYFTPAWARPPGTSDKHPATDIRDWAAYVSAAVTHYSALGIAQFEIWNEPNLDGFFGTAVSAEQYIELLKVADRAAKAANHNAFIVSAGLAPAADVCNASACRPKYFLDRMYKAGAKGSFRRLRHPPLLLAPARRHDVRR
jgi:hypothetical protein